MNRLEPDILTDPASRQVWADAFAEEGRVLEEKLLRSSMPLESRDEGIRPLLVPGKMEHQPDFRPWVNCEWGQVRIGGCWVHDEETAAEENRLNRHGLIEEGDLEVYQGAEMTGEGAPDADWYEENAGLDLTEEEADELTGWIQEASERVCEPVVAAGLNADLVADVNEEFRNARGSWEGCNWTHPCEYGYAVIDADGLDGDEDPVELARKHYNVMKNRGMRRGEKWFDFEENSDWVKAAERAIAYARDVATDARQAEQSALEAVLAADAGDWEEAVTRAREAVHIENHYGDSPTWSGLLEACERGSRRSK